MGLGLFLGRDRLEAGPSSLSSGALGWRLTRQYLEALEVKVVTLDLSLSEAPSEGTWILAFPWQYQAPLLDPSLVRRHLENGGDVVMAYSNGPVPSAAETSLFAEFFSVPTYERREAILNPLDWWRQRNAVIRLEPVEPFAGEALKLLHPRWFPQAPQDARVLYATADGTPVSFDWRLGEGRLVVLPAETLANARFADSSAAGWLATLASVTREPWVFDEFHHGVIAPGAIQASKGDLGFDLLIAQIGLIYLAAVWGWSRRMGPPWRSARTVSNTADSFLVGLGRVHDRQRHHAEAAELLLERAQLLDQRLTVDEQMKQRARRATADDLVALCTELERNRL